MTDADLLLTFGIVRQLGSEVVTDEQEARQVVASLLGPTEDGPRTVETDGPGCWLVGVTWGEAARVQREGFWLVIGQVDGETFEALAEWP